MKVFIIKSETFASNDINEEQSTLQETIDIWDVETEKIINIQKKTQYGGVSRFYIYVRA